MLIDIIHDNAYNVIMVRNQGTENTMNPYGTSIYKFTTYENASNFRDRAVNPGKYSIVQGPDMKYRVVTNRVASFLIRTGYRMAS